VKKAITPESGFGLLLELVVAMAITAILLAGSTAIVFRVRAVQNQVDAQMRLRQVAQAEAAIAICAQTPQCTPSIGLTAIVPADGSVIQQSGYAFAFHWNSGYWTYTAVPTSQNFSGVATFYADVTGIIRCMPNNDPAAGPTSPAC
jgi:type II secretory pathway pseudopilin PulG